MAEVREELRAAAGGVRDLAFLAPEDLALVESAAPFDVTVLLLGETGTGKGHVARAIAARSPRPDLISVNCAALPDELLGSELFGHVRGAFTGATADRKGLLVSARGKTVFLDEIGDVSPRMQRMLLGVLARSRRSVRPLGSDREVPVEDVRFILATNRDLEAEVAAGRFREDLLRRIDVVAIRLRPLRERRDLIPAYVGAFLDEFERLHRIRCVALDRAALEALEAYPWPGNVRDLKNAVEFALIAAPKERAGAWWSARVRRVDLPAAVRENRPGTPASAPPAETLDDVVKAHLERMLAATGGNIAETARRLGLKSKSSVYGMADRLGVPLPRRRVSK